MTNSSGTNLDSRKAGPAGTGSRDGARSEILIYKTGQPEVITASDGSLTVTVPIRIKRRGSRKAVTLPDGGGLGLPQNLARLAVHNGEACGQARAAGQFGLDQGTHARA